MSLSVQFHHGCRPPAGLGWVLWFQSVMAGIEQHEPEVTRALEKPPGGATAGSNPEVRRCIPLILSQHSFEQMSVSGLSVHAVIICTA